jgi:hypothetical protein
MNKSKTTIMPEEKKEGTFMDGFNSEMNKNEAPRPFPYYPTRPTLEMQIRNEAMMDLDKWANNDPEIAKRSAETLILVLAKQFDIKLAAL